MLRPEESKADLLFNVGVICLVAGILVLAGGWTLDEHIAILSGKLLGGVGAISLVGGILLQAIRSVFQREPRPEPQHSSCSKTDEIKFGAMFSLMALLGWKGPRDLPADARQAPLPPLLGLVPGLFCLILASPFLYVGLEGVLGKRPTDGPGIGYFFLVCGGILFLFALAFLIPAIRDLCQTQELSPCSKKPAGLWGGAGL